MEFRLQFWRIKCLNAVVFFEPNQVQRHLQLRIEAQGKYLQAVLEKAQETLGNQNLGALGLEAAKVQISDLVSKVSTECLNSAFSDLKELQGFCPPHVQMQTTQPADCSLDSCLTSCEGSQKEHELQNKRNGLRPYNSNALMEQREVMEDHRNHLLQHSDLRWPEDLKENKLFLSSSARNMSDLSMRVGFQGEKGGCSSMSFCDGKMKGRDEDGDAESEAKRRLDSARRESERLSQQGYRRLPYFETKLDLNVHEDTDAASSCKQFDLNGLSWT